MAIGAYLRAQLGDLPESLGRERLPGQLFDPRAGLAIDWVNRFKTVNFGVVLANTNNQTVLQDNGLRTYLLVQNQSAVNDLLLSFGTEAAASGIGSHIIIPRGNYELIGGQFGGSYVPKSSVNLRAAVAPIQALIHEGTLEPYEISTRN